MFRSRMEPLREEVGEARVVLKYSGHIGKCLACFWSFLKSFTCMHSFHPHYMPVRLGLQPSPFIDELTGIQRDNVTGPRLHSESVWWARTPDKAFLPDPVLLTSTGPCSDTGRDNFLEEMKQDLLTQTNSY